MDLTDSEYDPDNFPGLVYRTQDPTAANIIFRSGKLICTGADSVENVHTALQATCETLREVGIDVVDDPTITVQNIVISADLDTQLNLNAIAIGLGLERIEYEPEQFPGLIYRVNNPDVVILLFGSGKAIVTGTKTTDDAATALKTVAEELTNLGLLDGERASEGSSRYL